MPGSDASNLLSMASNLVAMASNLIANYSNSAQSLRGDEDRSLPLGDH